MNKKLHVTFLLPSNGVGGGVRAIKDFGNGLIALGHSVRVVYKLQHVDIARKIFRKYFRKAVDWLDYFHGEVESYHKSLNDIKFREKEIAISMCSQTTLDASQLPDSIIKVMYCHGLEYENWDRFIEAINLPIPKIAISNRVKETIEHYTTQKVMAVVPNGINHSEYYRDESIVKHGVGGCIRQSYSKDPKSTAHIFSLLHDQLPNLPLYSFGVGKKPSIYRQINYSDNPTVEEARGIYNKCKIWFLASIIEGFSLPVLEAMACGCVVVSTKCGGPQDLIIDGHNGYLVEVGNYGAIIYYINKLLADDELFQKMSENSINIAQNFSWPKSSEMLEKELYKLIQCH
jgi:glycosyltransferase involved in cell wall biosynthesis